MEPHDLTVRHFLAHTVAHELLHLDGKIWRSLRALMLRPGFLSAEYCAGRRNIYVNPVRLLITAVILYAILMAGGTSVTLRFGSVTLSIAPAKVTEGLSVADTISRLDRFGILQRMFEAKQRSRELESESARDRFHRKLESFAEPLSFTNVLLLTLALYALFHRRRTLLVEHGVFSIHIISFVLFSSVPVAWTIHFAFRLGVGLLLAFALIVWQFVYVTLAIRRFYIDPAHGALRRGATAFAAAVVIYVLNSAFITAVQLSGAALALWQM